MRDPHVQTIFYRIGSDEGITYFEPEPLTFTNSVGDFDLREGELRVVPVEHFDDSDSARQAIDAFLHAWEIEADLTSNVGTIRFAFERAEVIDRDPLPAGSPQELKLTGMSMTTFGGNVALHLTCRAYPEPPSSFSATPEVKRAYRRWIGYRQGKEPLQAMSYFVLTILETFAGGRKRAASLFAIDILILDAIGKLSSTRGDDSTARKAKAASAALTDSEKKWLEAAICRLIRRLGEHASGTCLSPTAMSDLPKLS